MKVTKKTTVQEALEAGPDVARVFEEFMLRCTGCGGAVAETLEMCARTHGLEPEKLIDEINRAIDEKSN